MIPKDRLLLNKGDKQPFTPTLGTLWHDGVRKRKRDVRACLDLGPPHFVSVKPPNYATAQPRCTNCGRFKRQHQAEAPP